MPRNVSNFTCSHLDLKKLPGVETPRPLLTGAGTEGEGKEWIKGFLLLKKGEGKGQERATGRGRRGNRRASGRRI